MADTKSLQKKLFKEIKGRIKLDDESLHFFYKKDGWEYWTKTTKENNYPILLRKKIDSKIFKDGSLRVTLAPVKFFGKEGQTQVKNQAEEAKSCEVGA